VEAKRRLTRDLYMFRRTEIEERILSAGFHVEAKRRLTMNHQTAALFYQVMRQFHENFLPLFKSLKGDRFCSIPQLKFKK
jgi:hypothetical protein